MEAISCGDCEEDNVTIPLLILVSIGNLLSFNIMTKSSMKTSSPGVYFAAIAYLDTMVVYFRLFLFFRKILLSVSIVSYMYVKIAILFYVSR